MPPQSSVLILGGTGYVGLAFSKECARRGWEARVVRRAEVDYTRFSPLLELLRSRRWSFVINCAGYTGKPNVDACEDHKADTPARQRHPARHDRPGLRGRRHPLGPRQLRLHLHRRPPPHAGWINPH